MRLITPFARRSAACAALAALLLLGGCAGLEKHPDPLSREEIVRMAKAGEPAKAIIARLQATDTVILLSAAEIVKLAAEGVPTEALDWMQQAQIAEIRRRDAFAHMYGGGFPGYGAFGPCPPGWGGRLGYPAYRLRSPFWPGC